jgi:hypothetical protein
MRFSFRESLCAFLALTQLLMFPVAQKLAADDHVVSTAELANQTRTAARARQANLAKVEKFFSSEAAGKALAAAKISPGQVQKAIPLLSDDELVRLASRADKLQSDFAAGALNNTEITYIIIALATALIVTIIFVAK